MISYPVLITLFKVEHKINLIFMKKYLIFLMVSAVVFSIMASGIPTSNVTSANLSLRQILQERHLTLGDNKIKSNSSRHMSSHDLIGNRIVSVDTYDFEWDDTNRVATVIDTSLFIMGRSVYLSQIDNSNGIANFQISGFYGKFTIPIEIDTITMSATIKIGMALSCDLSSEEQDFPDEPRSTSIVTKKMTLYVMPESWLIGDNQCDDVHGHVYDDGSFDFEGGFAFLIKNERYRDSSLVNTSWGLSPIFRDFTVLVPNGKHEFTKELQMFFYNKPAQPQPFGGGLVPRPIKPRPIDTKPVKPRPITPGNASKNEIQPSLIDTPLISCASSEGEDLRMESISNRSAPVYMYQIDDTTLLVFNLFGKNYCWNYMYIYAYGAMTFPAQVIGSTNNPISNYYGNPGKDIFNCSIKNDTLVWGNTGTMSHDTIFWDVTVPYFVPFSALHTDPNSIIIEINEQYYSNKLYFNNTASGGLNPGLLFARPVFAKPIVSDSAVVFSATTKDPNGEVYICVVDPNTGEEFWVDNPCQALRRHEPYFVHLKAMTYFPNTKKWSDAASLDYLVPARDYTLGDVNLDGYVDVDDVTALIAYVLSGIPESIHLSQANIDGDPNGIIDVDDLTLLINYVLTGTWPSTN